MAQLNHHPAPGLGDLLPGFFVVPQNPLEGRTSYVPRIGDILPAKFAVPQNPIRDYMGGRLNLIGREPGVVGMVNGKRVSCGGIGDCGCSSCSGLGGISDDLSAIGEKISAGDIMGAIQSPVFSIPLWGIVVGIGAAMMLMNQHGGRRR